LLNKQTQATFLQHKLHTSHSDLKYIKFQGRDHNLLLRKRPGRTKPWDKSRPVARF